MNRINCLQTFIVALLTICFSCQKAKDSSPSLQDTDSNLSNNLKASSSSYQVGGTIGCAISFVENRDNDKYDACMGLQLSGKNKLGNIKTTGGLQPLTKPCIPCSQPCIPCISTYGYNEQKEFWKLINLSEVDFSEALFPKQPDRRGMALTIAKMAISKYNRILYEIFSDANGNLKIPLDDSARRKAILDYNGPIYTEESLPLFVTPEKMIIYNTFLYEMEAEIPASFDREFFSTPDVNGKTSMTEYGAKVVIFPK